MPRHGVIPGRSRAALGAGELEVCGRSLDHQRGRVRLNEWLPNKRVQRTRSSPSAPHSPLTRKPLGGRSRFHGLVALLVLTVSAVIGCMHTWVGGTLYYP